MKTRLLLGPAVSTLLCAAPPAAAQGTPPPDPTPRFESAVEVEAEPSAEPPPSGVATRLPVETRDLPLSVGVVPRPLLEEQGAFVLGDALENVSGVTAATGFGVFDYFVVRGFDSLSSGLVLTDGIAEPESTFYPLYNVRQVEVLKGPAGFLHGGNPIAGAVQLSRKQPQPARFANLALGYGRYGTFEAAVDANAATADGRLSARLNATWQGSDAYRDLPDGRLGGLNPTLAWRPDEKTRLFVDFELARSEWPPDTGVPFVGDSGEELAPVPRTRSYQSPYDGSTQDVTRFRIEAERRLSDALTLRNRVYYTELTWDSDGTLVNGAFPFPDGNTYVPRTFVALDDRQRLLGNQLELASSFATGPVRHDLLAGFEIRSLKDRFQQDVALLPPLDLLNPAETAQPPLLPMSGLAQSGDSRALVLAPYVVDRLRLSSKLQAFVGGRLDVLDYEDEASATEREDTSFSPALGLSFAPVRDLSLYASWATAKAPPSTQVVGPREPETSRQLELGAKLALPGGRGFASAAVFQLERQDIAIPGENGVPQPAGDQRSRGLEVDLSVQPVPRWVTTASYAYTDAELTRYSELVPLAPPSFVVLDRSGNTAPFAPRHIFSLWSSRHFASGLGVGLGLRALGRQYVAEDNRYAIGSYATLDAMISYEVRRVRLRVNLRNLTGTEYATRGFGSVSAIPGRPFEVYARAEIGFGHRASAGR